MLFFSKIERKKKHGRSRIFVRCLLENLAVYNLLAFQLIFIAPESLDEGLVLIRDRSLNLGPSVVLSIVIGVNKRLDRLTSDQPHTSYIVGSFLTSDLHHTKEPLSDFARSLNKARHQVGGHKEHGILSIVVVSGDPQRPSLGIEGVPEGGHSIIIRGTVGIHFLPNISNEGRGRVSIQDLEGVFLLLGHGSGSRSRSAFLLLGILLVLLVLLLATFVVVVLVSLGLLLLLALLALLALLLRSLRDAASRHLFGAKHDFTNHGSEGRLVHTSHEPSLNVHNIRSVVSIHYELERVDEGRSHGNISQGHLVTNQESLVSQVFIQDEESSLEVILSLSNHLFIRREETQDRVEPDGSGELNLVGAKVHPRINKASLEGVLAVHASVSSKTSKISSNSVALEEGTLRSLKDGHLTQRALLSELRGHVVFAESEGGHVQLNSVVFSSDQALESSPVAQIRVKGEVRHG
jgi:hypothetical protein